MESKSIPNDHITASSEIKSRYASYGRLNHDRYSWCAETSDSNPYLQIDLQVLHIICAVSTQGNHRENQWVKNYKLQFSSTGSTWSDYKEGGQVKVKIYLSCCTLDRQKAMFCKLMRQCQWLLT